MRLEVLPLILLFLKAATASIAQSPGGPRTARSAAPERAPTPRGLLGLLSEAYSYATFEDRSLRDPRIRRRRRRHTDRRSDAGIASRAEQSASRVEILGGVTEERNPFSGERMLRRTDERRPESMWEFGTFAATVTERVPTAYLIPQSLASVLEHLEDHGVVMEPVTTAMTVTAERFRITGQEVAPRAFEGRIERTIESAWEAATVEIPAGTLRISLQQPSVGSSSHCSSRDRAMVSRPGGHSTPASTALRNTRSSGFRKALLQPGVSRTAVPHGSRTSDAPFSSGWL